MDPRAVVYVVAVVTAMVGAPFRSAQAGLIPQLVDTPGELTASNAVAANIENVVCFMGPAIGALMIGAFDVAAVVWLNVASFLWSFAMVAGREGTRGRRADEPRPTTSRRRACSAR